MVIFYKIYEFIYFILRFYYYKNDFDTCKTHTGIVYTAVIILPIVGLAIFLFDNQIASSYWASQSIGVRKILLLPVVILILIGSIFMLRKIGFVDKVIEKEEKGFSFKSFSLTHKIVYSTFIALMMLSVLIIPILLLILTGNGPK